MVNIEYKLDACRSLVNKAITYFEKHSIEESCRAFAYDQEWRRGEIELFVFDEGGVCYVFGDDYTVRWKDFQDKTTKADEAFIDEMLQTGKIGGMVDYKWNNSFMHSFVKTIERDGKQYAIGAGFFPISAEYWSEQMVKDAIKYAKSASPKQLFERIDNPRDGLMIAGDMFLWAMDMEGVIVAHGDNHALIGQNIFDEKTPDGKHFVRDILAIAKSEAGRGRYTYTTNQGLAQKELYIERLLDKKTGKEYVIIGGYYPHIDETNVTLLVKKAGAYLRTYGSEKSFPLFSKKSSDFTYGPLTLFVYDLQGNLLADSANPSFIGLNLMGSRDGEGKPITKSILDHVKEYPNGGWISFSMRNSYAMVYVEKVSVPDGDFIIGATYFPSSKHIQVRFMVDKAASYLTRYPKEEAFAQFSSRDPEFLRGDVHVFVYSENGTILVDGYKKDAIWDSRKDLKDDKGRLISDKIIAIAKSGGGWFTFKFNNGTMSVYVKEVVKQLPVKNKVESFIVGAGYYPA